jgi:hypothetical protein
MKHEGLLRKVEQLLDEVLIAPKDYPRKISCSRFLAQACDSTVLQKNTH